MVLAVIDPLHMSRLHVALTFRPDVVGLRICTLEKKMVAAERVLVSPSCAYRTAFIATAAIIDSGRVMKTCCDSTFWRRQYDRYRVI
jgi:hypothetical protein